MPLCRIGFVIVQVAPKVNTYEEPLASCRVVIAPLKLVKVSPPCDMTEYRAGAPLYIPKDPLLPLMTIVAVPGTSMIAVDKASNELEQVTVPVRKYSTPGVVPEVSTAWDVRLYPFRSTVPP